MREKKTQHRVDEAKDAVSEAIQRQQGGKREDEREDRQRSKAAAATASTAFRPRTQPPQRNDAVVDPLSRPGEKRVRDAATKSPQGGAVSRGSSWRSWS